jgi:Papain family cysteine protease
VVLACKLISELNAVQAFGAIGAIETAYYRITGKQRLFSEQNLIDCSWDIFDVSCRLVRIMFGSAQTIGIPHCTGRSCCDTTCCTLQGKLSNKGCCASFGFC